MTNPAEHKSANQPARKKMSVWLVEYLATSNGRWYPVHGHWYNFRKDAMKEVRAMNMQEDIAANSLRANRPAEYVRRKS